ncbi:Uncharacterised protein [Chromobacterium violaceum]|uniref:Uncharacterized protein n=1 Tax=Chromobacterium violaceum TaxID=536 RepID=A0A3S4HSI7_CHRVL|nr:Uncharacterised protein [Chromobacterium violaceum]
MGKITKAIQNPSLITKALKNRLNHFHKLYIEKDEFTIAVDQWFKDRGDESLRLDYPLSQNSVVFDLGGMLVILRVKFMRGMVVMSMFLSR